MDKNVALQEMRFTFQYVQDKGLDNWRIMKNRSERQGDCDDYSVTMHWLMCNGNMFRFWWKLLTFQAAIWYCRTPSGEGHAVLWFRGAGWVDNIYQQWDKKCPHKRYFPYPLPIVMLKMLVGKL